MVKLNMNVLIKSTSGRVVRRPEESDEQYLMKISHLYLENKQLESIGKEIGLCGNLSVLYLYDNHLNEMPDLSACDNLNHLYVQNNLMTRMSNAIFLFSLTKLYIGHNKIGFVEGFHQNKILEELYIEYQELRPGEMLIFDPRSMESIAISLTNLNISGNNIDSLHGIKQLRNLKQLLASDNKLEDIEETSEILSQFHALNRLELQQNPICSIKKYRDLIIVAVASLETLDGKEVSETSRQFLVKWKANKDAIDKRKESSKSKNLPAHLTANEMLLSSTQPQNRNFVSGRFSGNIIRPLSVPSK